MKEIDYTPALVGLIPPKSNAGGLFGGLKRKAQEAYYYEAIRTDQGVHLMWVENLEGDEGVVCHPNVFETDEETIVFLHGKDQYTKENNAYLLQRWNETVNSQILDEDYTLLKPTAGEYLALFIDYRNQALAERKKQGK